MKKKCRKCGIEKDISEYHKRSKSIDGKMNICAKCMNEYNRKYHHDNIEKENAGQRRRRLKPEMLKNNKKRYFKYKKEDPNYHQRQLDAVNKYHKNNKDKRYCNYKLNNKIKSGKIKREPCQVCGEEKVHGHHYDYSKPYDVIWLCKKHHAELHRKMRWDNDCV